MLEVLSYFIKIKVIKSAENGLGFEPDHHEDEHSPFSEITSYLEPSYGLLATNPNQKYLPAAKQETGPLV